MSVDHIQVVVDTPAFPLILADSVFLSTLTKVEEEAKSLRITDAASQQKAANLQQRLTTAGKKLDEAKKALKRPFIDINAKIEETAREPLARIEAAKNVLKFALTSYDEQQHKIAAEAEEKRQAEIARLEKIREQEEVEAKRKADELAAQMAEQARQAAAMAAKSNVPMPEVDFDEGPQEPAVPPPKTATELAIEAVRYAPAIAVTRPSGVRYKTTLTATIIDINTVPQVFVIKTANMQAIKSTFCTGYKDGAPLPVCPGVKFEAKREVDSTGKGMV